MCEKLRNRAVCAGVMESVGSTGSSSGNINNNNVANSGSEANEETTPRVKFLCSFGGSILPRPQDGKLRYVGGETRIVSVARDIGFEELMGRMREMYEAEGAVLKYQQPDEDLDALVSVVNDDDVTNMMEEYDKLEASGTGYTRLRIFLFSHPEQEISPHYMEGDERDTERRYLDALNSLSESPDYRRQQMNDSPVMNPVDEVHLADQLFSSMNLEGSVHNQRNFEMGMPQYNLRQLAVPRLGSGQHLSSVGQRYNEESPWSPAFYSPRCGGPHDTRTLTEFPSSPSSARYRVPYQEMPDKCVERFPEECSHQQGNSQIPYEYQHQCADNMGWLPPGGLPVDRGGFPGNILNGPGVVDGTGVCGNCKMTFQRNPSSSDFHWKPEEQSHLEQATVVNGFPQASNPCVDCFPNREATLQKTDSKLQHGMYNKELGDPRALYSETQAAERSWMLQNQLRMDEPRVHVSGVGRMGDHYTLGGTGANIPVGPCNLPNGSVLPTSYARPEDVRYIRAGAELGGEVFHGQSVGAGSHVHIPVEDQGVRTSNLPYSYAVETPQQVLHNHPSAQVPWRNVPAPMHVPPPVYDQPRNSMPSTAVPRNPAEGSPSFFAGVNQSPWAESSQRKFGVDGYPLPDYHHGHIPNLSAGAPSQELQQTFAQDPLNNPLETQSSFRLPSIVRNDNLLPSGPRGYSPVHRADTGDVDVSFDERSLHCEASGIPHLREAERSDVNGVHPTEDNYNAVKSIKHGEGVRDNFQREETDNRPLVEKADLSFLPELIASAKRAKLESAKVVKARAQEDCDAVISHGTPTELANAVETEPPDVDGHSDGGSDNENIDASTIEPTKAEEEAIAEGLQTIKNTDLEEIRELGCGTYGAVFHGKWKGSDVAIKRIKASCFAGRPSERERLIADFWKEALILSSLHHPNVVSFYGIVRDGPDGSLATVTEFMVNGSLKQYLQKKDRTIDRRKRLIIAMDAAFGMEYLHGKNIVHFDLKCENLLVNMRDPHRPVCKIGDLGLSKVKQHTLVSGGVRGTLPWMAPELLSGKSNMVTEKIDVYSFGIVMWELLTGEEPYKDRHCASIIGGIVNNTLRPQIPTWCDPEWKSLMESCWASEPADRPSFSEISQKLRTMAAAMNLK